MGSNGSSQDAPTGNISRRPYPAALAPVVAVRSVPVAPYVPRRGDMYSVMLTSEGATLVTSLAGCSDHVPIDNRVVMDTHKLPHAGCLILVMSKSLCSRASAFVLQLATTSLACAPTSHFELFVG